MFTRIFFAFFVIVCLGSLSFSDANVFEIVPSSSEVSVFDDFDAPVSPTASKVSDPLHGYNYAMTHFNDVAYSYVLIPISRGFGRVVPRPVRKGISNIFSNAFFPIRFVNSLLQLKLKRAGVEVVRFTVNSTVGLAGVFDPADAWLYLKSTPEDFGQTLGNMGIGGGPYIVWPLLGPSNLRDTVGLVADSFLNPINLTHHISENLVIRTTGAVNAVSLNPDEYDTLRGASLDFYSFIRDGYQQKRDHQISE